MLKWQPIAMGLCLIAIAFGTHYFVFYFFSVPQACGCRATAIPNTLSEATILDNSIGDASSITIRAGQINSKGLEICYAQKPKKGNMAAIIGLSPEGCEYENIYELEHKSQEMNDIEAFIEYDVAERIISVLPSNETRRTKTANAVLYLNRRTDACTFELPEWGGPKLSGKLECVNSVFYFNPWSWFPQTVELFYTRAFYAIHRKPAPTN